jgi:amino acid adenylation domain-containing protein
MTTAALLSELRRRGIRLSVDGDRLRCVAPKGALTPEIRDEIAARKPEILAILGAKTEAPPFRVIPRDGRLPLSFGQERLWFLHQMEPESPAHNVFSAIAFHLPIDVPALERAIAALVRRHETLRTVFEVADGEPVARILEPAPVHLPVLDLRTLTPLERDEEMQRLKADRASEPFDLSRALVRFTLVRTAEAEWELLIAQHHAITDRWSLGVLMNDLQELYDAESAGRAPALPDLRLQYVDFAQWQRESAETAVAARQVGYWRERLGGTLPVIDIPADRPRSPLQTYNGAWEGRLLPGSLNDALRALAQREGVTLFMASLAGFKALLARYTGVEDVIVGSPVAGRTREELEPVIGYFINTLVLRTDLAGNPTFREMLARVRDTALDAFAHQDVPFEQIVAELQLPRDLSRSPVFQIVFVLQNSPKSVEVKPDMTLTASGGTMFDLTLTLVEVKQGLQVTAEYNVDLFDRATIARLLESYETLLAAVTANPDLRLNAVPLLRGRQIPPADTSQGNVRPSGHETLHDVISHQALLTPDATAVAGGGEALTYAELEHRSNRIAQRLRALGVAPGTRVGVSVERSAGMVAALLGVLKAGGAYVPLDPAFPRERLAYMLEDAGARIIFADSASAAALPAHDANVVKLDEPAEWTGVSDAPAAAGVTPEDVAYVIYTSGSTGKPKGVAIPHRAVVNFLRSMAEAPGLTASDVVVAVTTLSFDIAGLEVFLPLIVGARVEVATREEASDGAALRALLERSGGTVLQATPATWRLLLEAGWQGHPGLRMFCGGEALPRDLADKLLEGGGTLWNLYGPTETTIWSTIEQVTAGHAVAIGRPIANTQAYVLDAAGQRVPPGVLGELYLGGAGLAHGYLGKPGLTAERFVPDGIGRTPGARLYRTGDVARWLADGRLECLGRLDQQVKVRGFRIELGEIEAALMSHPSIRAAAAAVHPDPAGEKRLVAYFVPEGEAATASDLRKFLRKRLPDYMVPSFFVELDAMPLTQNLKIDRLALPRTFGTPDLRDRHVPPASGTEQRIAQIWQDVLGIDRVSADANFFDVGGHSLLAMKVIARIEAGLGLRLNPRVLMLDTLQQIAAACDRQHGVPAASAGQPPRLARAI